MSPAGRSPAACPTDQAIASLASGREARRDATALALLLLLCAFALRLYLLDDASVWWDEAISAWTARLGLLDIARYQAAAVHPPLHYWFLHLWSAAVGDGEFALRYSSLLFGVLAVAVLYRLGTRLASQLAGLMAAALLAVSRLHIWWSQEIRMYALATLLALIALYAFLRWLEGSRGRIELIYGVATLLLLYTLYLGILTVVVQNAVVAAMLVARPRPWRDRLRLFVRWAALQGAIILAYLPWLYMMLLHEGQRSATDPPLEPDLFARIYATVLTLGVDTNIEQYGLLVLGLVAFGACSALWLWLARRQRFLVGTVVLYLTLPAALIYLLSLPSTAFYTPATNARYFLLVVPAWCLLLALAVKSCARRSPWLAVVLCLTFVVLAGYFARGYYIGRFKQDDYQTLTATIRAHAQAGDAIVLNPDTDWPIFQYHYRGDLPTVGLPHAERMTEAEVASLLEPVWEEHGRVWLVSSVKALSYDPEGNVSRWLAERGVEVIDRAYGDQRLLLYAHSGAAAAPLSLAAGAMPQQRVDAAMGPDLLFLGYDQRLSRVSSGQLVYLITWWQATAAPRHSYQLGLALVDDAGRVVARGRPKPLGAAVPVSQWQPATLQREEYAFAIRDDIKTGHYRWRLDLLDGQHRRPLARSLLGEVSVVQTHRPQAGAAGAPAHLVGARFGDYIELVGFDDNVADGAGLEEPLVLAPGADLQLTLRWRALAPIENSYTVFVHLLGSALNPERGNRIWGQHDDLPGNGDRPTTGWIVGETIVDQHTVVVDEEAPPGEYEVELGMYDRSTGRRLPVTIAGEQQQDDRFVPRRIVIR